MLGRTTPAEPTKAGADGIGKALAALRSRRVALRWSLPPLEAGVGADRSRRSPVADVVDDAVRARARATRARAERLLPNDPQQQVAEIKRPERFYPQDGLVLYVTSRDMPREGQKEKPAVGGWRQLAWNQDYAWFTKSEAKQFLPTEPQVGKKHDLPRAVVYRIACAQHPSVSMLDALGLAGRARGIHDEGKLPG